MKRLAYFTLMLVAFILFLDCDVTNSKITCPPNDQLKPLTVSLIEKYRLKEHELGQFQYFLSNDLELVGDLRYSEHNVSRDLAFDYYVENDRIYIYFPDCLPGVITHVDQKPLIKLFKYEFFQKPMQITVCFNNRTDACLTFAPDSKGIYRILPDKGTKNKIYFDGTRFSLGDNWQQVGLDIYIRDTRLWNDPQQYEIQPRRLVDP